MLPFNPPPNPPLNIRARRIKATEPGERLFLSVGCTHPDYGDFFLATFDARLSAQPHLPNETASLGTLLRWVRARVGARQACGGAPRRCRAAALARAPQGCRLGLLGQHCPATLDVLTAAHCLKLSSRCRYGFQPHRVALWIYWHAVLLLWKGVPFFGWVGPGAGEE